MGHTYLECVSDQELERLGAQHAAWGPETESFLVDSGFPSAKSIIDFGCGPGFTTIDLATKVSPRARVTALDISGYYLRALEAKIRDDGLSTVSVVERDASLPEWGIGPFDSAFCRWFLAWVTKDLDSVLSNIHSALVPGGKIAVMEYLSLETTVHSPPCSALGKYLAAWETFYEEAGGTTKVGAILPRKLRQAGFDVVAVRSVGGLAPKGHRLFEWWKRLHADFTPRFVQKGLLDRADVDSPEKFWKDADADSNSFVYTPIIVQILGIKPR